MRRFLLVAVFAVCLPVLACGQGADIAVSPPTAKLAAASAERNGNWLVNPNASHLKFSAVQERKRFNGEFTQFSAVINFFPKRLDNSSVRVTVPLRYADAGSADRNSALLDKVWFSAKKFALATFEAEDFTKTGPNDYLAKGTLTMKGQARDFDLPFTLEFDDKGQAIMRASLVLDRTHWGVGEAPWDTSETVSTEVALDILVTASNPN